MIVQRWSSGHKPFEDQGMRAQETKEKLWNL